MARATYAYCSWSAEHHGDSVSEVVSFLRPLLFRHVVTCHPERVTRSGVLIEERLNIKKKESDA